MIWTRDQGTHRKPRINDDDDDSGGDDDEGDDDDHLATIIRYHFSVSCTAGCKSCHVLPMGCHGTKVVDMKRAVPEGDMDSAPTTRP